MLPTPDSSLEQQHGALSLSLSSIAMKKRRADGDLGQRDRLTLKEVVMDVDRGKAEERKTEEPTNDASFGEGERVKMTTIPPPRTSLSVLATRAAFPHLCVDHCEETPPAGEEEADPGQRESSSFLRSVSPLRSLLSQLFSPQSPRSPSWSRRRLQTFLLFSVLVVVAIWSFAPPPTSLSSSFSSSSPAFFSSLSSSSPGRNLRRTASAHPWEQTLEELSGTTVRREEREERGEEGIARPPSLSSLSPSLSLSSSSSSPSSSLCPPAAGHDAADNWKFVTVTSDILITVAYYAIPLELNYFQKQVKLPEKFGGILLLFQMFICCCGSTHLIAVWQPWYKFYFLSSMVKLLTALVSMLTACVLVHVIPKALALPGMAERLEEELGVRVKNESDLREKNEMLMKFRSASQNIGDAAGATEMCRTAAREMCENIETVSSVAIFLPSSLTRFGIGLSSCSSSASDAGEEEEEEEKVEGDSSKENDYFCAAEFSKRFPGSALYSFSWKEVTLNSDREEILSDSLFPGNRLVSLSEESVEKLIEGGAGNEGKKTKTVAFPFHSTSLVQFSVDDSSKNGLVLISSTSPSSRWTLKRSEVTFLEDIVHQVEIALSQAVQMEKEKERMYELSLQQKKNAELDKAKQLAEMESKLTTEFLASMSHEIRTPMNAIIGFVSYLLQSPGLSADQHEILQTISSSSQTLLTILNDILDFSKAETRQLVLKEEVFSVRHCVETALQLMAGSADSKSLDLNYFMEEDVPDVVFADPYRLQQVILNLLSNGIKFTERGEVFIIVSLQGSPALIEELGRGEGSGEYIAPKDPSSRHLLGVEEESSLEGEEEIETARNREKRELRRRRRKGEKGVYHQKNGHVAANGQIGGGRERKVKGGGGRDGDEKEEEKESKRDKREIETVFFHVIDTGIGIPSSSLRLLFQKFKQVDSSIGRRYGGTGLGLAISAKLVHMYRGMIKVTSQPGRGSAFSFSMELPVVRETEDERESFLSSSSTSPCYWAVDEAAGRLSSQLGDELEKDVVAPALSRKKSSGTGSLSSSSSSSAASLSSYWLLALVASASVRTRDATEQLLKSLNVEKVHTFNTVESLLDFARDSRGREEEDEGKEERGETVGGGEKRKEKKRRRTRVTLALVDENLLCHIVPGGETGARYDAFVSLPSTYAITLARSSQTAADLSCPLPPAYLHRALCKPVRRDLLRNHLGAIVEALEGGERDESLSGGGRMGGEEAGRLNLSSTSSQLPRIGSRGRRGRGTWTSSRQEIPKQVKRVLEQVAVLIVDDNAVNRKVMIRLLELFDMRNVQQAANGYEAISMVADGQFDIVFMDVAMPVLDGFSATRRIQSELSSSSSSCPSVLQGQEERAVEGGKVPERKMKREEEERGSSDEAKKEEVARRKSFTGRRIPWIIAMTASTLMEERQLCFDAGMNDFLAKPITPPEVANVLTRFVQQIGA